MEKQLLKVGDLVVYIGNSPNLLKLRLFELSGIDKGQGRGLIKNHSAYHPELLNLRLAKEADLDWKKTVIECKGHGQEVADWLGIKTDKAADRGRYLKIERVAVTPNVSSVQWANDNWPEQAGYLAITYDQWLAVTGRSSDILIEDCIVGPLGNARLQDVVMQCFAANGFPDPRLTAPWQFLFITKGQVDFSDHKTPNIDPIDFLKRFSGLKEDQPETPVEKPPTEPKRERLARADAHKFNLGSTDFDDYVRDNRAAIEATSMMQLAVDSQAALIHRVQKNADGINCRKCGYQVCDGGIKCSGE